MGADIRLPLLDSVRIASPCPARWEDMAGDDRKRRCAQCDLDVHNIAALTRDEAEVVLSGAVEGRVCVRLYRRFDGTILTRDCPRGLALARRRVLAAASRVAAAVGLATLAGAAAKASQDTRWGNYGWSLRLSNVKPVQWVVWKIETMFPRAMGGRAVPGDVMIAQPPGPAPDVKGAYGAYGPKAWEYRE